MVRTSHGSDTRAHITHLATTAAAAAAALVQQTHTTQHMHDPPMSCVFIENTLSCVASMHERRKDKKEETSSVVIFILFSPLCYTKKKMSTHSIFRVVLSIECPSNREYVQNTIMTHLLSRHSGAAITKISPHRHKHVSHQASSIHTHDPPTHTHK